MKKYRLILSMLAVLLCVTVTGCSSKDNGISPILGGRKVGINCSNL